MILQDIAKLLADNSIGTVGTDILIGSLPDQPDNAIMILPGVSGEQDKYQELRTLNIDVWCRNKDYLVGYNKLQDVYNLLHRASNYTLTDFYVYFSQAVSGIEDLSQDSQGRKLKKVSFKLIYKSNVIIS